MPRPSIPSDDLTVAQVAHYVGVQRARVYQRITGEPKGASGRPLDATIRHTGRPGTRRGRQTLVSRAAARAWRDERLAAGLKVGPEIPEA